MTEWEQRRIFSSLDKIVELLQELVDFNNGILCVDSVAEVTSDITCSDDVGEVVEEPAESRKASVAKADRDRYNSYRRSGGELKWNEWRKKDKEQRIS